MQHKAILAPVANPENEKHGLAVHFQHFNGVFLAKISDRKGRETYAYGASKCKAEHNALRNYKIKYLNTSL